MRPLALTFLVLFSALQPAAAQTTETPVPFDTSGRIASVSASLANRLGLSAPAWPVTGAFIEARLFQVSSGGFTLTAVRPGGTTDRFQLSDEQGVALRSAFAEAMARAGRMVAEDAATIISEPARGPFVRDQMLLASIIYGPSLAALTHDPSMGSGAYLLTVGGTFFALNDFARRRSISKAQNALTTDGALRGWLGTALAAKALGATLSDDATALTALVGGIGGSVMGYQRGRLLTHAEAQAAMTGSTLAAGTALGLGFTSGLVGKDDGRGASAAVLTGGIAGYVIGARYPRQAPYSVTAGDVSLVRLGAILGSTAAISPFLESNIDGKAAAALMTVGWVGGALIADRVAALPFNHTIGDSRMIYLGALGGGLMGIALPTMTKSESPVFVMMTLAGGAIIGSVVTQKLMSPTRQGSAVLPPTTNGSSVKLEVLPEALALTLAKQPGRHSLLRIRF